MPPTQPNENSAGPVIAVVIVMAMIILGGLYFWGERSNSANTDNTDASAAVESIQAQSASDETSSIEADLNATNVDDLGSDLDSL